MNRAPFLALAALALALAACSAGTGGDWPIPDLKGPLAECHALGDVCGGAGWCGATRDDVLVCCPVQLEEDGIHCPGAGTPGVTECVVDEDCPEVACHEAASCIGGRCFAARKPLPALCPVATGSLGVCGDDGACHTCDTDSACNAANTNECAVLVCGVTGCESEPLPTGARCNFSNGECNQDTNQCVIQ